MTVLVSAESTVFFPLEGDVPLVVFVLGWVFFNALIPSVSAFWVILNMIWIQS